jgi:hypothetical protein
VANLVEELRGLGRHRAGDRLHLEDEACTV